MMSLVIVSISEITPWVFSNTDASENSVMLDAACFDSVLSVPTETLFISETVEPEVQSATQTAPEVFTEAAQAVTEAVTVIPETTAEAAVEEEPATAETLTEPEETTEAETQAPTEAETKEEKTEKQEKVLIISDDMLWPVAHKSEVVEGFPRYSSGGAHHGIDIFVVGTDGRNRDGNGNSLSYGKPFRAAKDGVVVEAANNGKYNTGFGNYCVIDHGDGTQTLYAHAKTVYVSVGDTVKQGQTIGEIGGTGNTTAPHLHFEVRVGGVRVNPLNYVSEPRR